jgi:hydrogenase nickel incorporation protein HypB
MCSVCGCGQAEVVLESDKAGAAEADVQRRGAANVFAHDHGDGLGQHSHPRLDHDHVHDLPHEHIHDDAARRGAAFGGAYAPGAVPERMVKIEQDILSKNNAFARDNRASFAAQRLFALNVVSSPGSGKTSLLVKAIEALKGRLEVAVVEGDQQTSNDAERVRATGARAIQINTGKGCHLDAHMVGHAVEALKPAPGSALFIENVGNLVCPAAFDLGEARRVVVLSVTEGEDKPLKYPDMFASADLMLLNKADLLPHLDFDVGQCLANALRINPRLQTLIVSAKTGEGVGAFAAWIEASAEGRAAAIAGA